MNLSKQQREVLDAVRTTNSNVGIQATAGAGKTFILLQIADLIPKFKKSVFLSFSNAIVNELKAKVPSHILASTLHSFGCKLLFANYSRLKVNENKWFSILMKTYNLDEVKDVKAAYKECYQCQDIINFARMTTTSFEPQPLQQMCDKFQLNYTPELINKVIYVYNENKNNKLRQIDFTDMIVLPVELGLVNGEYDYVLLDEAQDLNNCQRTFIEKMLKKDGRLIFVGDEKQCIYGFSGSEIDSLQRLQNRPNTINLALTTTYRCAKAVVAKAKEIYSDVIDAYQDNIEGQVIEDDSIDNIQADDIVICRTTLPLVVLFFELLQRGVKCQIVGKDYESGLQDIANRCVSTSLDEALINLSQYLETVENKLVEKKVQKPHKHPTYIAAEERVEILKVILLNIDNPANLGKVVQDIFSNEKGGVRLMTIHRSKGLEADNVYMITHYQGEKLNPHKSATQDWEKIQEQNLLFVAYTRAKKKLSFITL